MIKGLFVLDTLRQRFGVTSVAMNYFRNFDKEVVHVDFLCFPDSESSVIDEITSNGSKVFFMPKPGVASLFKYIKFQESFFMEHRDYSIIHSHFNQVDSIIFPIAKKYCNCICISHSHSTSFSKSKIRAIRNYLLCLNIKKKADVWAACSIKAGIFLYGKAFKTSAKSRLIYNGIDCNKFKYSEETRLEIRKELNIHDEIVIGHVGSFNAIKNHPFLIKLFTQLQEVSSERYKLLLVGDGELKKQIEEMVKLANLSKHVIFTGVRKDVHKLFQAMDIFLLPSFNEGMPVVGIEAQASGLPCIFSDAITREVGICNFNFLSISNTKEWINHILNYQNNNRSNCYNLVSESGYDMTTCARKLESVYSECLDSIKNSNA